MLAAIARQVLAHYADLMARHGLQDRVGARQALQALFPHPATTLDVALAPAQPAGALRLVGPG